MDVVYDGTYDHNDKCEKLTRIQTATETFSLK